MEAVITITTVSNRVKILKEKLVQSLELPFQELLPESAIQQVINELKIKYRCRLFDPFVTLWAFLSQVLEADKSCHNAVSRVISYLVGESQEIPSTDTSAYCPCSLKITRRTTAKAFW